MKYATDDAELSSYRTPIVRAVCWCIPGRLKANDAYYSDRMSAIIQKCQGKYGNWHLQVWRLCFILDLCTSSIIIKNVGRHDWTNVSQCHVVNNGIDVYRFWVIKYLAARSPLRKTSLRTMRGIWRSRFCSLYLTKLKMRIFSAAC